MVIAFFAGIFLLLGGLIALGWWLGSRRLEKRRQAQKAFYALSEEIITAGSPIEIAERLNTVLPTVTEATSAQLYLLNRATRCLERVRTSAAPQPLSAPVDDPPEGLAGGAVTAFNEGKLLSIPDVRRSPFVKVGAGKDSPRAVVFVPLFQGRHSADATRSAKPSAKPGLEGVLEVDNADHYGYFTASDLTAFQHLANQIAASLTLQKQNAMREQLFRGEKVAATGQLIAGVASELGKPLENLAQLSRLLAEYGGQPVPADDIDLLKQEVQHAADIVARLVSFSNTENAVPVQVDIAALLTGLIRFRESEWKAQGLRLQNHVRAGRCLVWGVEPQLEQVLLTLLVHAGQRASLAPSKLISISTETMNHRVLVEIAYGVPPAEQGELDDPFTDDTTENGSAEPRAPQALGLGVCRTIIGNHGGEIRLHKSPGMSGFELELPPVQDAAAIAAEPAAIGSPAIAAPVRPMTLMLIDADASSSRHLTSMLSERKHRVVPTSAEEAPELVGRLQFDAVLWAVRSGRGSWGKSQEQVRAAATAFVLITDGYDQELAHSLEQTGGYLLTRPVQEAALDRVLGLIATNQ